MCLSADMTSLFLGRKIFFNKNVHRTLRTFEFWGLQNLVLKRFLNRKPPNMVAFLYLPTLSLALLRIRILVGIEKHDAKKLVQCKLWPKLA